MTLFLMIVFKNNFDILIFIIIMEVVYYQGSDAHQYLQDVELLDDEDIQSAVPFCLAD